jgi:very-short-patch-repair endonuclease
MDIESLKERARFLRREMTDTERKLWSILQYRKISNFKFRRQQIIGPYIVDFVCLSRHLIIECDGAQHALNQVYDQKRDHFLKTHGFRVLRFWNLDVLQNIEGVYDEILRALET